MKSIYESNLYYLAQTHPVIYRTLDQHLNTFTNCSYELIKNDNETFNLYSSEQAKHFYSKYNPQHECQRWLQSLELAFLDGGDIVLYGLGLTYHLAELLNHYPNARILIYEPEVAIFIEMMKLVDLKSLFDHPQILQISVGKDKENINGFLYYVSRYAMLHFSFVEVPFYKQIDIEHYKNFLRALKENKIGKLAEASYYDRFGTQMFGNIIRNLPKMIKTQSIGKLKNQFKGATAVIVGGGPSLEKDIIGIKQRQNNWLIIAAGSSVQSLLHYGVMPHLIVSMDPGIYNTNVFKNFDLTKLPLLFIPQIHHEVLQLHPNRNMYAYFTNDAIMDMLTSMDEIDYKFLPTFSVTGTAIQAAAYMGANTILLAGQDLSYPEEKMYAAGATHLGNNAYKNLEGRLSHEVDNVMGGKNPTTFSMLQTRDNLEGLIKELKEIRFINITSQGAVIKGADYHALETIILDQRIAFDFDSIIQAVDDPIISNDLDPIVKDLDDKISGMIIEVSELEKVCIKVNSDIAKLKDLSRIQPNKAMGQLAELESYWAETLSRPGFKKLIEYWMTLELNEYDRRVIEIGKEQQLIKKISLLDEILGEFVGQMQQQLTIIQQEFELALQELRL